MKKNNSYLVATIIFFVLSLALLAVSYLGFYTMLSLLYETGADNIVGFIVVIIVFLPVAIFVEAISGVLSGVSLGLNIHFTKKTNHNIARAFGKVNIILSSFALLFFIASTIMFFINSSFKDPNPGETKNTVEAINLLINLIR